MNETALGTCEVPQAHLLFPTVPKLLSRLQDEFDKDMMRARFREVEASYEAGRAHDVFEAERFIDKARRVWEQRFPANPFHE